MSMDTVGIEVWLQEQTSKLPMSDIPSAEEIGSDIPDGLDVRGRLGELIVEYGLEADQEASN